MSSLPSATAEIRWMRPRGDEGSRSVSTYVGQVGRHSPQRMQRCRTSSLGWSLPMKPCTADIVAILSEVDADATTCCCTSLLTLALAFQRTTLIYRERSACLPTVPYHMYQTRHIWGV